MASTVRDFAIKITADTKELQTNTNSAIKVVTKLVTKLKGIFKSVDKDVKKAAKTVNQEIQKIAAQMAKNTKKEMENVVKAVKQGGKQKANAHKEAANKIKQIDDEAAKDRKALLRQQTQEAVKELKNQIKQLDREAEQFGDLDVVKINKTQAIQDVQELGRVIKSSNKTTQEEIRIQLKRLDGQKISDIKDAEQKLKQILAQAQRNQAQAAKEAAKRRLQQANLTAEQRLEIAKKLQRQLQRIQEQGAARQQATRQTSARRQQQAPGEQRTGRIGRGGALISEIGSSAQRAAGPLGAFGAALGKLGPIGIAAAAGLGALALGLKKAFEASEEFEDGQARIRTLLTEQQAMDLGAPMLQLRDAAKETGESIKVLQDGLFFTISAVPELANNIDAAASITVKASKAAIGLGASTDEVVLAAAGLGNALGLNIAETEAQNQIFDVLANTMKQGVIPSGQELAANIAKTAPTMGFLAEKSDEALKVIGAMTAQMTGAGISTAEAQTQIKSLANELLKTSTRTALLKEGMKGVDAETGKVKDWRLLFQSMGEDVGKFTSMFSRKEAQNAIRIFTKNGGEDFDKMLTSFDQAGGTAETMFDTMASTGEATSKRLSATWNDLWITLGEGSVPFVNDVRNTASAAIEALNDFFKSAEQSASESQERFQQSVDTANAIGDSIKTVEESIAEAGKEGADQAGIVAAEIQRIGETTNQFKDQFPVIAQQIQNIINAEGEKTVETLRILNEELGRAQELAQAEAFLESFEGAAVGLDAIVEKIENVGFLGEVAANQFGGAFSDGIAFLNDNIAGVDEQINALFEEQKTLDPLVNTEDAERARELGKELAVLNDKQQQFSRARLATETGIQQFIDKEISQAKTLAESKKQEFNLEQQIFAIQGQLTEKFGNQGKTLELINQLTNDRAETERILSEEKAIASAKEVGDLQTVIDLENQKKQLKIDELNSQMQLLDMMGLLTEEQKTAIQSQIESLDVSKQAFGVSVDIVGSLSEGLDLTVDQVDANKELTEEKEDQIDLSEEKSFIDEAVNDLTSDILDNETLTTDEKIAQLDLLIDAQDVQLQTLNDQIKGQEDKLISQEEFNKLSEEEQANALETAKAIKKQVAALKEEVAIVDAAKAGIEGKKEETQTRERVRGAIGGGRDRSARDAQRAERTRERDAAKAEKEKLKEQDNIAKARAKQEEDAAKAREKLENEREKRREEDAKRITEMLNKEIEARQKAREKLIKINEQRIEAEKSATKSIREFRNALEETIAKTRVDLISGISQAVSGFDTLKDEFKKVASRATGLVQLSREQLVDSVREQAIALIDAQEEIKNVNRTMLIQNGIIGDVENAVTGVSGDITKTAVTNRVLDATEFGRDIATIAINQRATLSSQKNALIAAGITGELLQDVIDRVQDGFTEERSITTSRINPALRNIVTALEKMNVDLSNIDTGNADAIIAVLESIEKRSDVVLTSPVATQTDVGFAELRGIAEFSTLSELFKLLGDNLRGALTSFQAAGSVEQFEAAGLEFSRLTEDLGLAQFTLGDMQTNYADLLEVIELVTGAFNKELDGQVITLEDILAANEDLTAEQKEQLELLNNREAISQEDLALLRTKIPLLIQQTEQLQQQVDFQADLAETQAALLRNQERFSDAIEVTNSLASQYETTLTEQEVTVETINQKYDEQLQQLKAARNTLRAQENLLLKQDGRLNDQLATEKRLLENDRQRLINLQALLAIDPTDQTTRDEIDALNISIREQEDRVSDLTEKERLNQEQLDDNTESLNTNTEAQENNNEVKKEELDLFDKKQVADFITEMTTQIGTLNTTSLTGFLSTIGNSVGAVSDLFEKASKATGENAEALRDAAIEGLSGIVVGTAAIFEQAFATAEQGIESFQKIIKQVKAGAPGEVVSEVGDIVTKVGKALLGAPFPLDIAGAVILGVGLYTKAVGKIISAFKGREQTAQEKAEQRLTTIERQNDAIRTQLDLINDLAALGDASVDTARERLDLLEKEKAALIERGAGFGRSQEELLAEKATFEKRVDLLEDFLGQSEKVREFSNDAQQSFLDDVNESFGTAFDFGDNIKKSDIDEVMDFFKGEIAKGNAGLANLELITELNESILQEQFNKLEERVKSAEFRIKIATEFEDPELFLQSQEDLLNTLGDRLNTALLKAGVGTQITDLTKDELLNLRDEFETLFAEGEVPADIIASWGALLEAIEGTNQKEREFVESQLEDEKQMIELIRLREGAAKISTAEADEQVIKLLEEQIGIVNDQIDALGMSVELEMLLLGLQQELNALKAEENETDEESNRLLGISVRKRQELIETFRQEQKGGTLTGTQRQKLAQSEKEIVAQLKASGATQDDIDDFLRTLPAFETGGLVPETGAALVHEGELIIPANQVKEMEDQIRLFSQGIVSTNPIINGTDPLTQEFSRIILEREAQNINNNMINVNIGDIINNIPKTASDPEKIVAAINANIQSTIMGTVQRGIDQNKLDIRGKKT